MKIFSNILVTTFIGLYASVALAKPNCAGTPFGQNCYKCVGWMNYSTLSQTACHLNPNPPGTSGFACNGVYAMKKCGVIKKYNDLETPKKELQLPDAASEPNQE